ncbi:hypothetical protein BC2926_16700 [Bacillus cereus]|nr:hypothetical protein BC2926_16700 [Bacillus cereus]
MGDEQTPPQLVKVSLYVVECVLVYSTRGSCRNKEKFPYKVLTSILNKSNIFYVIKISLC